MSAEEVIKLQQQVAAGSDQKALERLYTFYYSRLYRFACALVSQSEVAEEIVEDVFIRLWENRSGVAEIRNLQVYLYVAIRNRALNYLDWKSRDLISYFETYPEDISMSVDTPERMLITKEMASQINKAVDALPPKCKLVFKLIREEGLKYREAAEILNISPRTVDTQMTIALKKIACAITLKTIA
jgi:RNA polymerase sigma-70 factor (ECF subfamily)